MFILCFWVPQEIEGRVKLLVDFFVSNQEEKVHDSLISADFMEIKRVVDVDFVSIGFDGLVIIRYPFIVNWINLFSWSRSLPLGTALRTTSCSFLSRNSIEYLIGLLCPMSSM